MAVYEYTPPSRCNGNTNYLRQALVPPWKGLASLFIRSKEKLPLRIELGILSSGHISHSNHASENTRRLSTALPTVLVSLGLNLSMLPKKSIFNLEIITD